MAFEIRQKIPALQEKEFRRLRGRCVGRPLDAIDKRDLAEHLPRVS